MKIYHLILAISLAIPSLIFTPNAEAHKHFNKVKNITSSEKITNNGYEILKEKNYIHASKKFSEALKTNPKNKFALLLRAYSKKELKDYKSALKDLNTILKIDSEYNAAVALRAWVNIKLENYPEAIDDYSKLIAYDLMLKDSYGNRGFLKEIMQDKEGACSDWQKGGALGNEKASSAFENHCKSV